MDGTALGRTIRCVRNTLGIVDGRTDEIDGPQPLLDLGNGGCIYSPHTPCVRRTSASQGSKTRPVLLLCPPQPSPSTRNEVREEPDARCGSVRCCGVCHPAWIDCVFVTNGTLCARHKAAGPSDRPYREVLVRPEPEAASCRRYSNQMGVLLKHLRFDPFCCERTPAVCIAVVGACELFLPQ